MNKFTRSSELHHRHIDNIDKIINCGTAWVGIYLCNKLQKDQLLKQTNTSAFTRYGLTADRRE